MTETIYLSAPTAVRDSDRYEQFYYLLSHHFKGAEVLEARDLFPTPAKWHAGWKAVLERIDTLVFIRNEQRAIGQGTWTEVCEANNAGKRVLLARMNRENELVLVPWEKLAFTLNKASKRNYARIGYAREMREQVQAAG